MHTLLVVELQLPTIAGQAASSAAHLGTMHKCAHAFRHVYAGFSHQWHYATQPFWVGPT